MGKELYQFPMPSFLGWDLRDLRINKIPIFEREGWLCQPSLSKIGILFSCKSLSTAYPNQLRDFWEWSTPKITQLHNTNVLRCSRSLPIFHL